MRVPYQDDITIVYITYKYVCMGKRTENFIIIHQQQQQQKCYEKCKN